MDYYSTMDQEFYDNNVAHSNYGSSTDSYIPFGLIGESFSDNPNLGGSHFNQLVVQGKMNMGANTIELGLGDSNSGVSGAQTYGKDARQAIREIAKANDVKYTIHAPVSIGSMSGKTKQDGFNRIARKEGMDELKHVIDFAADVSGNGAIVVHTGEDYRDLTSAPNIRGKASFQGKEVDYEFDNYFSDNETLVDTIVDRRNGKLVGQITKGSKLYLPKFKTENNSIKTFDNNQSIGVISSGDKEIPDIDYTSSDRFYNYINSMPQSSSTDGLELQELTYDDVVDLSKKYNEKHNTQIDPSLMFFKLKKESEFAQAKSQYDLQKNQYSDMYKKWEKIKDGIKAYERFYPQLDENHKHKFKIVEPFLGNVLPPDVKDPIEYLRKQENDLRNQLNGLKQNILKSAEEIKLQQDVFNNIDSGNKFAKTKSAEGYADAGIYAMKKSKDSPFINTEKGKNLYIAAENIFPENGYGSHPEELIDLVQSARDKMVEKLTSQTIDYVDEEGVEHKNAPNPNYDPRIDREEAEKLAKDHIRATIDFQHLSMWRKYFKPKVKEDGRYESQEETDERFNVWYMNQIEKLQKADVLGHMHVVDAMGPTHNHLPAGQGKFPVKNAVDFLLKKGYDTDKFTLISEGYGENSSQGVSRSLNATNAHMSGYSSMGDITNLSFMQAESSLGSYGGATNYMTAGYMNPLQRERWSGWFDFRGL